jgi:hypothetical protein
LIPKVISDELRKYIKYNAPCNELIPSKEELTKSLFSDSVVV